MELARAMGQNNKLIKAAAMRVLLALIRSLRRRPTSWRSTKSDSFGTSSEGD